MRDQPEQATDSSVFSRSDIDDDTEAERTKGLIEPVALGEWMDAQRHPPERASPSPAGSSPGGPPTRSSRSAGASTAGPCAARPATSPRAANETMMREYRILSAAGRHRRPPTPEPPAATDDTSVLGAAFYLMDFVDGWSPISEPGWPEPFGSDIDVRPGLAYELVDAIARLSKVDWQANGLEGPGPPRRVPRAPGRPLVRPPSTGSSSATSPASDEAGDWLRGRTPPQLHAGHHARRLPVRQRHVPPRRPPPAWPPSSIGRWALWATPCSTSPGW